VTAADDAQVSKFFYDIGIPGIKLSYIYVILYIIYYINLYVAIVCCETFQHFLEVPCFCSDTDSRMQAVNASLDYFSVLRDRTLQVLIVYSIYYIVYEDWLSTYKRKIKYKRIINRCF
jgi:hypothetical protein